MKTGFDTHRVLYKLCLINWALLRGMKISKLVLLNQSWQGSEFDPHYVHPCAISKLHLVNYKTTLCRALTFGLHALIEPRVRLNIKQLVPRGGRPFFCWVEMASLVINAVWNCFIVVVISCDSSWALTLCRRVPSISYWFCLVQKHKWRVYSL